jgi:amino acid transporter
MTMGSTWDAVVAAVSATTVGANLLVSLAFIVLFAREPWRKSVFGRSVMTLAVALLMFSVLGVLVTFLGENYPFRDEVRALGRLLILGAMGSRLWVLFRLQRGDRRP